MSQDLNFAPLFPTLVEYNSAQGNVPSIHPAGRKFLYQKTSNRLPVVEFLCRAAHYGQKGNESFPEQVLKKNLLHQENGPSSPIANNLNRHV